MSPYILSTLGAVAHAVIIVGLSVHVIMRRAPIGVSLAWLTIIAALPFVGAVLYFFFGEKQLGRKRIARIQEVVAEVRPWLDHVARLPEVSALDANAPGAAVGRLAERVLASPVLEGNELELIPDFQSIFDALIRDIDAATDSCLMQFYIWFEGGRSNDVIDALVKASERGVSCRVLADAMGSKEFLRGSQAQRLRGAGVRVVPALPVRLFSLHGARVDLRNHRKVVVIDERIGYTGSQNLVDPRFFKQDAGVGEWVDAMVRVQGPVVAGLATTFLVDWAVETGERFAPPNIPSLRSPAGAKVQAFPSGPGYAPETLHRLVLSAIFSAQEELTITTPYFVPDEATLTAIVAAASRGVDVTLIVPAENDSLLVRYASVAHFDDLMAAGAKIALFQGGLLHTKSATADGQVSVFGSVNLDMRSLFLNFEISLLVYDANFTGRLLDLQQSYLAQSKMLELDEWRKRPLWRKFVENTFRLASPLL